MVVQSDCLAWLKGLADASVYVTVTSPPYNLGGDFHTSPRNTKRKTYGAYENYGDNMPEDAYQAWQVAVLQELYRVTREDGICFYNHKNRIKDGLCISPLVWLSKTDWLLKQVIVLNFQASANVDKCRFFPVHELLFILVKDKMTALRNEGAFTDVWSLRNAVRTDHPATFPMDVPLRCIGSVVSKGLVIDPFVGTGVTGVAASQLGFEFAGCDISAKYCTIARKNIANEVSQIKLEALMLDENLS